MRHLKIGRQLSRKSGHRRAMLRNMASSLIHFEHMKTSVSKAKELRRMIEPIITLSKIDTLANRRLVFSKIRNHKNISKLFNELGPRFKKRSGGYVRILKCGFRTGDNSPMAYIELVDRFKSK